MLPNGRIDPGMLGHWSRTC